MNDLRDRLQAALGEEYRVGEELGGGGMSRVFVAEDVELSRKVVVKVLPPDLAAGLNVDRFRREIQMAARLQHPHIVPLLHAGAKDGLLYYTMPFISGESLRGRLARSGELPIADAIRILVEVADALEAAHADGVVHRDVKPENILLARNHALVTDFGVSKALANATGESNLTSLGVALGTPAYMSPEQAAADPNVDHRTDIYALGVLAYELLTGRPPFTGATPQQVLAAQVTDKPQHITAARASIPAPLAAVIMRCLEKRPADRWQTAEELRAQLEVLASPSGATQPVSGVEPATQAAPRRSSRAYLFAGGAAAVLALALVASTFLNSSETGFEIEQARQLTNEPGAETMPAVSPDGRMLAYVTAAGIFVRQLSGGKAVQIARGLAPSWSPDASQIAYGSDRGIYVVPALGGTPRRVLSDAGAPSWSPDGKSLAYVGRDAWVRIADADGRNPRNVAQARDPYSIAWSPDGSRLAFVADNSAWVAGNIAPSAIMIVDASGGKAVAITDSLNLNTSPRWSADGSGIFYVSSSGGGRDIYFRRIDRRGRAAGEPQRLTTGLALHAISTSADGSVLVYSTLTSAVGIWSVPIPSGGPVSVATARQLTAANERIEALSVSADGKWIAFDSDRSGNQDIYRMPTGGGEPEQVTRDPADDFNPSWSNDGAAIAFHSWRAGNRDAYVISADGTGERLVLGGSGHEYGPRWSPDGKWLVIESDRTGKDELYIVARDGGPPRQLTKNGAHARPFWSPNGRWIAYVNEDGLYIISPSGGEPIHVRDGGFELGGWSSDSREVYVLTETGGALAYEAVNLETRTARPLLRFDRPDRIPYRGEFVAQNGSFYFTVGTYEADLWTVQLRAR
ncbi:MAG: protein kinase domain-containing protein [Gemmatimonadaceae bacterium]